MNSIKQRPVSAAISQLRAEIEALPKDSGGKRQGIPKELKRRVVAALTESQLPVREFAAAVSVSVSAVSNWSKRLGQRRRKTSKGGTVAPAGFKKVSVVAQPEATGRFTIEGPSGMRVSGLAAADVARLWRALC